MAFAIPYIIEVFFFECPLPLCSILKYYGLWSYNPKQWLQISEDTTLYNTQVYLFHHSQIHLIVFPPISLNWIQYCSHQRRSSNDPNILSSANTMSYIVFFAVYCDTFFCRQVMQSPTWPSLSPASASPIGGYTQLSFL